MHLCLSYQFHMPMPIDAIIVMENFVNENVRAQLSLYLGKSEDDCA